MSSVYTHARADVPAAAAAMSRPAYLNIIGLLQLKFKMMHTT